jgi:esterase/lipase superfamily enzyme
MPSRLRFGPTTSRAARCLTAVALAAVAGTGCVARTRAITATMRRDTLWYVSARARHEGHDRRALSDSLEYGAAIFDYAPVRDPFTDGLTVALRDSLSLTRDTFLSALRARVSTQAAPDDFAVLYVHGFGTGLGECWNQPVTARVRSRTTAPWVAFCWPSHGVGVAWPRVGSLFVSAYEDDTAAVTASAPAFRRVLTEVTGAIGAPQLLLVAHSLGGRLVSEALLQPTAIDVSGADAPRLRAMAFLALDHDAARFADTIVPALRTRARRLVLYTSRRDRALGISRRFHDRPRAGLAEPTPLQRPGLETVDMTEALAAEGWWQRHFGNRHSVRRASATVWDLTHVVGRASAASCRDTLAFGAQNADGSWRLLAGKRPDTTRLARCQPFTPADGTVPSLARQER